MNANEAKMLTEKRREEMNLGIKSEIDKEKLTKKVNILFEYMIGKGNEKIGKSIKKGRYNATIYKKTLTPISSHIDAGSLFQKYLNESEYEALLKAENYYKEMGFLVKKENIENGAIFSHLKFIVYWD